MHATSLVRPASVAEAVQFIASRSGTARVVGGGTWMMRNDDPAEVLVDLTSLQETKELTVGPGGFRIGGSVTHVQLARALKTHLGFGGLRDAAGKSANPHVRNRATVGGNVCSLGFAQADLVPALIACGAQVDVAHVDGRSSHDIETWAPEEGDILIAVHTDAWFTTSAHARLTLRAAGDYPVALVSVAAALDDAGRVEKVRLALGALTARAFRWTELESALLGQRLDPQFAAAEAARLSHTLASNDGIGVPGWYRRAILPTLVHESVSGLNEGTIA